MGSSRLKKHCRARNSTAVGLAGAAARHTGAGHTCHERASAIVVRAGRIHQL